MRLKKQHKEREYFFTWKDKQYKYMNKGPEAGHVYSRLTDGSYKKMKRASYTDLLYIESCIEKTPPTTEFFPYEPDQDN